MTSKDSEYGCSNDNGKALEKQFSELLSMIKYHRSRASKAVNEQQPLTAWNVGTCESVIVQSRTAQFVKSEIGQIPC